MKIRKNSKEAKELLRKVERGILLAIKKVNIVDSQAGEPDHIIRQMSYDDLITDLKSKYYKLYFEDNEYRVSAWWTVSISFIENPNSRIKKIERFLNPPKKTFIQRIKTALYRYYLPIPSYQTHQNSQ